MKHLILYAEDDKPLARVFIKVFESVGYKVNWARDGKEALELYHKEPPDIVVLDVIMPEYDGEEVVKIIRTKDLITPILMLTCIEHKEIEIKCINCGADDYIRKTVDNKVLLAKIARLIGRHPVYRDPKIIITADTWLDMSQNKLFSAGNSGKISYQDKKLLVYLWENKNFLLKRETIEDLIWGKNNLNKENYLYKSLSLLRKIMADDEKITLQTNREDGIMLIVKE